MNADIHYHIYWTKSAGADLRHIINYISIDHPTNARNITKLLRAKAKTLKSHPFRGRIVPELKKDTIIQYRELIVDCWRMIYHVSEKTVHITALIDSRRNTEDILLTRFLH